MIIKYLTKLKGRVIIKCETSVCTNCTKTSSKILCFSTTKNMKNFEKTIEKVRIIYYNSRA